MCGGKDCLTQCCWNFCRAGMWLPASVRGNLWLTLTPKMRRTCPVGEDRNAVTWHSSSRCLDFWLVTHKTHDRVGVAGPCERGGVTVWGHHGGCGCTGPGKRNSSCGQELLSGACTVPSSRLCCSTKIYKQLCLPSQGLSEELGWPDKRPDAKGAGDRAQLGELRKRDQSPDKCTMASRT